MKLSQATISEWFNGLPEDWPAIPIKYGFRLIGSGTTPPTSEVRHYDGTVPWVNTSELRENVIYTTEKMLTTEAVNEFSTLKTYPVGTVLFAMYGATLGRVAILGIPATVNQAVCALAEPCRFDSRFVYYGLQASREFLSTLASGGGQPNLNSETLRQHKLPCPKLHQQKAIANFLDHETTRLDTLIAAKQNLLNLLAEKRRTLITSSVTRGINPKVKLKDSGYSWLGMVPKHWDIERSKWLFKERDIRSEFGDEEMLTVSHITGVTTRAEKTVNMFLAESQEGSKICEAGDLVINTLWAWMGAMGVSPQRGIVSPAYNIYEPCDKLDPSYVDYLVRMPIFAQEAIRFSKGVWSSRLRLYPEGLYEIWFPVPPVEEQRAIVKYLTIETMKINAFKEATDRTIALLRERRTALIASAVTGQISVPSA